MSARPRLAVLAVLAAGGTAFGGYYLWPSGRHLASCAQKHAPVPAAAQRALEVYAGRIRHDVERSLPATREESWSDPLTGRMRQVSYEHGRLAFAFGTMPAGKFERSIWVLYDGRSWMSSRTRLPGTVTVANAAAQAAQANRDKVARGKATIVGKEAIAGRPAIHLRETIHFPRQPRFRVDTWVDPLTYATVRARFTVRGHSSVSDETWLPRTPANLAATRIVVPAGFTREHEHGNVLTSSFTVSRGCD
jgi:hypothetical protein